MKFSGVRHGIMDRVLHCEQELRGLHPAYFYFFFPWLQNAETRKFKLKEISQWKSRREKRKTTRLEHGPSGRMSVL